jgi:hypothetical protein
VPTLEQTTQNREVVSELTVLEFYSGKKALSAQCDEQDLF